jgi:heme exporter protein B
MTNSNFQRWFFSFWVVFDCSLKGAWQKKAVWVGTLFFAASILILFPFAMGTQASAREDLRLGIFWATCEFVIALLSLRMFSAENEQGMLEWWLASPTPKSAILLGKALFIALELLSLQVCMLFFWMILYNFPPTGLRHLLEVLLPVMFLFAIGTAALGALLQAVVAKTQAREILFPILFYPMQVSLLLASTTLVLKHENVYKLAGGWQTQAWWSILIFFPILMISLCFVLSQTLLEDSQ